jgi:hypothetical protein
MKFISSITKLANKPPWAPMVSLRDGTNGFWIETKNGHKLFISDKNNLIHLPKSLRGKSTSSITLDDLNNVPKNDLGQVHYDNWKVIFDIKNKIKKVYDGHNFTKYGQDILNRLKDFIIKNKLDNVSEYGIDNKFSINLNIFDKIQSTPYIQKVRELGKILGKKYSDIIYLLHQNGKEKIVEKIDPNFEYLWKKIEPLFNIDLNNYIPQTDKMVFKKYNLLELLNELENELTNIIDPQMVEFINHFEAFYDNINKSNIFAAKFDYQKMNHDLLDYLTKNKNSHIEEIATRILNLNSFIEFHHILFEETKGIDI